MSDITRSTRTARYSGREVLAPVGRRASAASIRAQESPPSEQSRVKILLTNNQFQQFAGSELVTFEIGEYFASRGHACTIATWYSAPPMARLATETGISIVTKPQNLNIFDFDMLWLHHHIAPVMKFEFSESARERTLFVWNHLSTTGSFAMPGLVVQNLCADMTYAVSEEARVVLARHGLQPQQVGIMPNPAPRYFWTTSSRPIAPKVQSALVVSNHAPPELLGALEILASQGVRVRHVGKNGEGQRRVSRQLLQNHDVVIAIGKTVQYALVAKCLIYVYDHLGGPGYLNASNFDKAAFHNFSGRCTRRKLSASEIAREIVDEYHEAYDFMSGMKPDYLRKYELAIYLEDALGRVPSALPNADRARILQQHEPMLLRERAVCLGAGFAYRGHLVMRKQLDRGAAHRPE